MADLFNQDFQDFIAALNKEAVEYILVGGSAFAGVLHLQISSHKNKLNINKKTLLVAIRNSIKKYS